MPTTIHPSPEDGGTPALGEAAASSHPYAGVAMPGSAPPEPPEAVVRFNYPDSHSFVFMAHPDWFDVFKTGPSTYEVLPSLRTVRRKPGSCGVKYVKGHDDGDATLPG